MAYVTDGKSVTINSPTDDNSWTILGGSLTIAAGAQFPFMTTIIILGQGRLMITGGSLDSSGKISVLQRSTAAISGGEIGGNVMIGQESTVSVSGGQVANVIIAQSSHVTLSGGVIGTGSLFQGSTLTVQGSGLVLDSSKPFQWTVTGKLSDGTALNLTLQVATNQNPHVVLQNS